MALADRAPRHLKARAAKYACGTMAIKPPLKHRVSTYFVQCQQQQAQRNKHCQLGQGNTMDRRTRYFSTAHACLAILSLPIPTRVSSSIRARAL